MMYMSIKQNSGNNKSFGYSRRSVNQGFTLIELLVTIAILAILVAIVVPSYNAQVRKGSRSDAITGLTKAAQDLERCRSDTLAYTTPPCTNYIGGILSDRQLYTIRAADINGAADQNEQDFTLRADPVAGTTQANDTQCTVFTLDHTGLRQAFNTSDDSGTNTTAECWR